ncbi:hypothetical protein [Aliamphritea hakodatensis]|uniref:hypothetical protein n=1 Tax=Aliamphritea hakodatensis TaxID=2895352 RepID=UPI0022FD40FD|nr:hypothetical protein [Aliamphritea hakodatensis]
MLKLGLALLILPGVVLMALFWQDLGVMRDCQAQGLSFDPYAQSCSETEQAFVPFGQRNPVLVNSVMLLSVLGLACCLYGLYVRAR